MKHSRRDVLSWALGVGTGLGAQPKAAFADSPSYRSQRGAAPDARTNMLTVGPGGDYPDVMSAMTSIQDNAEANPYLVFIQPGVYEAFEMKPYVDVIGSGRNATVIEASSAKPVVAAAQSMLTDLRIQYSGNSGGPNAAALTRRSAVTEFVAQNIEINVESIRGSAGPRWAIGFFSGSHDATFCDIKIRTESGGIYLTSGNYRIHSTDCYLAGDAVGLPHIALQVASAARVDWFGGRLGTGYYYDQDLNDPLQDVIGVYVPQTNVGGGRVHLHGAIVFARNIVAASNVRVHAVRADNGWVRLFGCMCQAEPSSENDSKTLHAAYRTPEQPAQGDGGKIEVYGSRITDFEGNVFGGGGTIGVSAYDVSHDGLVLSKYEGGLILCDASQGPFKLFLPASMRIGDSYAFKKIDASTNTVTINAKSNRLIDGAIQRVLDAQYAVLRIVAGDDTYHLV